MDRQEVPLTGGRITAGVVRVGNTVRRPILGDRSLVHELLVDLESRGFDATPRFLGVDDKNREILTYLPGEVPVDLGHYSDDQLAVAAALLRRFHDATATFATARYPQAEIICHNDWGPPNAVFRDGKPWGMIDFDTLAPGTRLWDLGYSAFSWLDLGDPGYTDDEQIRRLAVFADAYGSPACTPAQIAVHAVARQTALASWGREQGKSEIAEWAAAVATWTVLNVTEKFLPTGYGR